MNIGSVFLSLLADDSKLAPQVEDAAQKAGDAGAKTLGQKLAGGLKTNGIKAFGAVASAAFGIATKGALELEDVQARITAETGASADEAKKAAKAINSIAGDERTSLDAVADASIAVRRNLGAVGDEANDLTRDFVRFARVTKQEPAAAVADFGDILDAWAIPASRSGEIMDKLIVSGQKYGGVITDDQKALAAMAPQLKALNLNIDDGITLLDLFKQSGLDAAQIPKALNSAIQKLDGRPLEDFVKELAGIEDPGKRAQRAMEIFGAKAGASLANAIKPGMTSLADLAITTDEATGATERAADAIDSTWGARFQKLLSQAGAALRGFGQDLGPVATGFASIASLAGAIGLDDFIKKFAGKMAEAGKAGGEALIDAVGTATGAAGTVIGNLVAQALDPHNPFLNGVIGKTAAAAGRLWGTVFGAAVDVAESIASAVGRIPGASKVSSAIEKSGAFLGTKFGKAFGIAAAVGSVLWFLDEWNKQRSGIDAQAEKIGADIAASIQRGNLEELKRQRAAVAKALQDLMGIDPSTIGQFDPLKPFRTLLASGAIDKLQGELNDLDSAIGALQTTTEQPIISPKAFIGPPVPADLLRKQGAQAVQEVLNGASGAIQHVGRGPASPAVQLGRALSLEPSQISQASTDARQAMARIIGAAADGLRSRRAAIDSALSQLRDDITHQLSPKKEVALRIGQLFSKTIVQGLHSADPAVKAQAEYTRALIEDQLIETIKAGGKAGEKILEDLRQKMHSKDPQVRAQAQRTKETIDAALKATPGKNPGDVIGDQLASDLRSQNSQLGGVAYQLGRTIARNLIAGVEGTGQVSSGGGGGGGARKRQHGGPVEAGEPYVIGERGPELFVPDESGVVVPSVASSVESSAPARDGGGDTFNLFLPDARHTDPWAVLDRLPRYAKVAKAAAGESGWKAA